MNSNCWVICHPNGDPYTAEDPHYPTQGDAIDGIKALGPVAILTARTGRLVDPCDHPAGSQP